MNEKLPLIGRDRVLIDQFTKTIYDRLSGEMTPIRERRRGNNFEVRLEDGRIAKVTVELDRVEH